MTPWHARIDRVIRWLKWPTAIFSTAALPTVFWAIYGLGRDIGSEPWRIVSFLIGIAIFMVAWRSWLATTRIGNWLIQFEHELTHMIFAILTFHPVIGFRASVARGSHIRFVGEGNWLITAAPYFFPTAAVFLWFFSWFLPIQFLLGRVSRWGSPWDITSCRRSAKRTSSKTISRRLGSDSPGCFCLSRTYGSWGC